MARVASGAIVQHHNKGASVGINYGALTVKNFNGTELSPKDLAKNDHSKAKAAWSRLNTCDWFVQREDVKAWFSMQQDRHSVLWLVGSPGHGKTTLMQASRLIEYIGIEREKAAAPKPFHLLYFYIGYGNEEETERLYQTLLLAFLQQLGPSDSAHETFDSNTSAETILDALDQSLAATQNDIYVVVDALDQLPTEYSDRLLEDLHYLHTKLKEKAHSTTMRKDTLVVAATLDIQTGNPGEDYSELVEDAHQFVWLCRHLIEFDEELGIFQFFHVSIYQFFRGYKETERNSLIARICLAHLCSADFAEGAEDDAKWYHYGELDHFLRDHPFLEFASLNWADSLKKRDVGNSIDSARENASLTKKVDDHTEAKENTTSTEDETETFLERLLGKADGWADKKNLQLSFQIYLFALKKPMPRGVCQTHIASFFALDAFFSSCDFAWGKRDDEGLAAIHWFIRGRAEARISPQAGKKRQAEKRAETGKAAGVDKPRGGDETKEVHKSTETGEITETEKRARETAQQTMTNIVDALIEFHADALNALDKRGRTPLHHAAQYGDLDMVKLLTERKAELDIQSKRGETPLMAACKLHHHNNNTAKTAEDEEAQQEKISVTTTPYSTF
ncbi:hypothetical protein J3F83DRAFT_767964 [Trichoderma novae-zelandiae]